MILAVVFLIALGISGGICYGTGLFDSLDWLWILPLSTLGLFAGILLALFLFIWGCCAVIPRNENPEKDSPFYRHLAHFTIEGILELLQVRLHVEGLELLPEEKRVMLVCNHLDILDPLMLIHVMPQLHLGFVAKRESREMFLVGPLMQKILCQFLNRENDREGLKTILHCVDLINRREVSIGAFPEGTTSPDGKLMAFRNGIFKIAQKTHVPVVVCTLQNTQFIFKNARHLRHTDVHVHVAEVIRCDGPDRVIATELGRRAHAAMARDLGPELGGTEENS